MRTLRTVAEVRASVARARAAGRTVALVPTMGAFHAGHEALMGAGRAAGDEVVVSLFVNPAQFDDAGDLGAYPRDEARDAAVAASLGVDVLYAPAVAEVYPPGFATTVAVGAPAEGLEGAVRGPDHFAGVCTVVCKLLVCVAPDVAFFGEKDAQQLAVIRRMVRDLDLPVRIAAVPTVRDADGLALSSRNARLPAAERPRALALPSALAAVRDAVLAGEPDLRRAEAAGRAVLAAAGVRPDYLALVDPDTMAPAERPAGRLLAVVAARIGPVRLIDNVSIDTDWVATPQRAPTQTGATR